jgi:hypothetical protein
MRRRQPEPEMEELTPQPQKENHSHKHPWLDAACGRSPLLWHTIHFLMHLLLTQLVFWLMGAGVLVWAVWYFNWKTTCTVTLVCLVCVGKWFQDKTRTDNEAQCRLLVRAISG